MTCIPSGPRSLAGFQSFDRRKRRRRYTYLTCSVASSRVRWSKAWTPSSVSTSFSSSFCTSSCTRSIFSLLSLQNNNTSKDITPNVNIFFCCFCCKPVHHCAPGQSSVFFLCSKTKHQKILPPTSAPSSADRRELGQSAVFFLCRNTTHQKTLPPTSTSSSAVSVVNLTDLATLWEEWKGANCQWMN